MARLVLLHGFGANEDDLKPLAAELDLPLDVHCFRAPLELAFGAFAWFPLLPDPIEGFTYDDKDVAFALDFVEDLLTEMGEPVYLGGFSQGSMVALAVAARCPDLVRGLWLMSGRVLLESMPANWTPASKTLPVLIQHGTGDPVVPVEDGRATRDYLRAQGLAPIYSEYPMGHEISRSSLKEAQRVLGSWLQSQQSVVDSHHS